MASGGSGPASGDSSTPVNDSPDSPAPSPLPFGGSNTTNGASQYQQNSMRRTTSLETVYLKGQWPRDATALLTYCGKPLVDKSTQTPEEWYNQSFEQSTPLNGSENSEVSAASSTTSPSTTSSLTSNSSCQSPTPSSSVVNGAAAQSGPGQESFEKFIRQKLQRNNRESSHHRGGSSSSVNHSNHNNTNGNHSAASSPLMMMMGVGGSGSGVAAANGASSTGTGVPGATGNGVTAGGARHSPVQADHSLLLHGATGGSGPLPIPTASTPLLIQYGAMYGGSGNGSSSSHRGTPRMKNSVEGFNQEIERIVLKAMSGCKDDDRRKELPPDGRRAPVAELLRRTRSVDTQTSTGHHHHHRHHHHHSRHHHHSSHHQQHGLSSSRRLSSRHGPMVSPSHNARASSPCNNRVTSSSTASTYSSNVTSSSSPSSFLYAKGGKPHGRRFRHHHYSSSSVTSSSSAMGTVSSSSGMARASPSMGIVMGLDDDEEFQASHLMTGLQLDDPSSVPDGCASPALSQPDDDNDSQSYSPASSRSASPTSPSPSPTPGVDDSSAVSPMIPGSLEVSRPPSDEDKDYWPYSPSLDAGARDLGSSPQINRFLAREPPDGCERVPLRIGEEVRKLMPWESCERNFPPVELKRSLGSAFYPFKMRQSNSVSSSTPGNGATSATTTTPAAMSANNTGPTPPPVSTTTQVFGTLSPTPFGQ